MSWIRILFTFLLLLNIVLSWKLFGHDDGWKSYLELQHRRDSIVQQISAIEEINLDLSREIRRLITDHEYVASVIRMEMHYLQPNEVLYIPQNDTFRRLP
ncbi:Septum formation initiator [Desulfonatronum thiosulfatophilum]|uniref:Septum formation initiator n=1 Tax=Desulfonatronum thiosulfatophilum TaxID=617002 RepID=A0A1G6BK14_9BACT|nr:septum formation initiator family protein [Desulfonatronum thiosulfatophilum]SDB20929.1 Septum formation initiator [Desulfonatronum thiosulfatophilum]